MIKAFADKKKTGGRKGISPFGGGQGEVSLLARITNPRQQSIMSYD